MTNFTKIFAALAFLAVGSSAVSAQTDFGSPIGAGGGLGGTIAPFLPMGSGTAGLSENGSAGLNNIRNAFRSASGATYRVTNPAGGTVDVPSEVIQALAAVLAGNPTPAQVAIVTNSLTGVPATAASTLVASLQTFGGASDLANLRRAITAYNAAIDALSAGVNPPPALSAIRLALFEASRS